MQDQPGGAVTVRRALRTDVPRLAQLLSEFRTIPMPVEEAENRFSLIDRDPEQELLVACAGDHLVGLLAFRLRHNLEGVSHYGEIATIVVDSAHRGHGIGEVLVNVAQERAVARACVGLWLVSGFGREEEAHRFYERLGFERTGVRFVKTFRNS
jgi:ribosomal protein S18 acetylase RimI-like enzyme